MNGLAACSLDRYLLGTEAPRPPSESRGLFTCAAARLGAMTTHERTIPTDAGALDPEQVVGLADMDPES